MSLQSINGLTTGVYAITSFILSTPTMNLSQRLLVGDTFQVPEKKLLNHGNQYTNHKTRRPVNKNGSIFGPSQGPKS